MPQRLCIGCGLHSSKRALIRIVKNKDGEISLDVTGKKSGRGAYICKNKECIEKVSKTKGLDRTFKMQVSKETYQKLIEEMRNLGE